MATQTGRAVVGVLGGSWTDPQGPGGSGGWFGADFWSFLEVISKVRLSKSISKVRLIKSLILLSHSHSLTLSHSHISKRQHRTVTHPKRELCIVISKKTRRTVAHPNSELCIVISKKARLNRSQSEQGTLHCYIEKDKTEPFPILTANSALLHQKKRDWIGPHVIHAHAHTHSHTQTLSHTERVRTEPCFIQTANSLTKKINLNRYTKKTLPNRYPSQ